jgi:mono/diheme cytochrome c family protein
MKTAGLLAIGTCFVALSLVEGQDGQTSSTAGVYTEEQAARGQKAYDSQCGRCHETARFTGEAFIEAWKGQPAYALFDSIRTTMPEDNPNSLRPQQYADIVAYLLKLNEFPAGSEELPATSVALKAVRLEFQKDPS